MENRISIFVLAARMAEATGKSRKLCEDFIREFFRLASESLSEGENLRIKGFGSFKVTEVDTRGSVNVATGEPQKIEAHKKVVFTPSKEMTTLINAPFEFFESVEVDDDITFDLEKEGIAETSDNPILENKEEKEPAPVILEVGSDEEGLDDDITYEAYHEQTKDSHVETAPDSVITAAASHNVTSDLVKEYAVESPAFKDGKEDLEPEIIYVDSPGKFKKGVLIGSVCTFAVCAVVFMLGCFFNWWPVNFGKVEVSAPVPVAEQTVVVPDTAEESTEIEEEVPPVYDTVSTTRYLTTISREHYGNFNFWPYIYLENESILGHPDRITPGTKVIVPPLAKYGVDPTSKEDEKEAKKLGLEIYSRFR